MVAIVALIAAAVLLVVGWITGSDAQLIAACVLAGLVALALIADRFLPRTSPQDARGSGADVVGGAAAAQAVAVEPPADVAEPGEETVHEAPVDTTEDAAEDAESVVFVPGRMTFHRPDCRLVAAKNVGRGSRADLEGAGMNACRSCLRA